MFKVSTTKNQDHFFQATHLEEREAWIKDIKRAISCLQGGKKFARKSTRRSIRLPDTVNLRYNSQQATFQIHSTAHLDLTRVRFEKNFYNTELYVT